MNQKFNVTGMTCSACSSSVEKAVKKLSGIESVNVNLLSNSMTVDYDENNIDKSEIIKAVVDAGYGASEFVRGANANSTKEKEVNPVETEIKEMKKRTIISFAFLIPLMYVSMGHMFNLPHPSWLMGAENAISFAFIQLLLTIPIIYVNRKYYEVGFKTLFHGSPNMDSLIAIGSSAALVYGIFAIFRIGYGLGHNDLSIVNQYSKDLYFESAAMILALITFGKMLETRAKGRTSEAISKLMDLAPKTASVIRNGNEIEIPVEDVVKDDIIIVRPGQSIPVDGVIIEGSSSVDQAALTGESIPREVNVGDSVLSGFVNGSGLITVKATSEFSNSTASKIINMLENSNEKKTKAEKFITRFSKIYNSPNVEIFLEPDTIGLNCIK